MPLRARILKFGKLSLLVGALGGTFGLSAFAGMQAALKTREVTTPDLRGLSPQDADRRLAGVGAPHAHRAAASHSPGHRGGSGGRAGSGPRHHDAPPAQRQAVAQLGSEPGRKVPTLIGESEDRSSTTAAGQRLPAGGCFRDPLRPLSDRCGRRAGAAPRKQRRSRLAAWSTAASGVAHT